ncbi:hypothetical protein RFI_23039 [Reticulomyxa filosa]|uniref:Tubulin-tyrosine ligase family protein n=1 Tax=Reticulomyxa filosa TaxID=46433 RepID=X6MJZ1_RETFI|nr:hypothetical protein RFI_23039 [Reticulomyxa filosa]|eukprot:ETO14328.1 hypothetical protein RFI_23039 [Reticulomyxa filosa]
MGNSSSNKKEKEKKGVGSKETEKKEENEKKEDLYAWEKDGSVNTKLKFDDWYPVVEKFTMRSELIPINIKEIRAIMNAHESKRPQNVGMTISKEDTEQLEVFKKRIEEFLKKKTSDENKEKEEKEEKKEGIFLRFSNRSPKDSILRINKEKFEESVRKLVKEIYEAQKKSLEQYSNEAQIVNAIIRALTILTSSQLCILNGDMAMDLVLNSERLFTDFKMGELIRGDDYQTQLILREFNHQIDFECEFRCFVFKDRMTCISQYNSMAFVPRIVENQLLIPTSIVKYWSSNIHPLMQQAGITSYVLDLALVKDSMDIILIEINPFCTKAGALLFDWKSDLQILLSADPVVFRFCQQPHSQQPEHLTSELHSIFQSAFELLKTSSQQ